MKNRIVLSLLILVLTGCSTDPTPVQHDQYPEVCDAKLALIEAWCDRKSACDDSDTETCVVAYVEYFGWSGCAFVPLHSDDEINVCLDDFSAFGCPFRNDGPLPSSCDGVFDASDELADDPTSPDQLPH